MYSFRLLRGTFVGLAVAMTLCGTASATTVTSPNGSTPTEHSHSVKSKKVKVIILGSASECETSTIHKTTESHGTGVTAKGAVASLTFSGCDDDVTVKKAGSIEVHPTGSGNGTLTSSGAEISIQLTSLGITCVFTTSNTDIGKITGSSTTGGKAISHIKGTLPRTGGSILCGSTGEWEGEYEMTSPSSWNVD